MRFSWSKIDCFMACPMKYKLRYEDNIQTKLKKKSLCMGYCIAEALAVYRESGSFPSAMSAFNDAWIEDDKILALSKVDDPQRSVERGLEILCEYTKMFPDDPKQAISPEVKFEVEITPDGFKEISANVDTKTFPNDIYSGRIDGIFNIENSIMIVEDKTASRFGESYFDSICRSYQVIWYLLAADTLDLFVCPTTGQRLVPKALINFIYINAKKFDFERRHSYITRPQLRASYTQLLGWIDQIKYCKTTNVWPKANQSVCAMYGGCEYLPLKTLNPNDSMWDRIVSANYKRDDQGITTRKYDGNGFLMAYEKGENNATF